MKLNKTLGRVATTLVAGAMLTALAMPAYAENPANTEYSFTVNTAVKLSDDGSTPYAPDVDIEYKLEALDQLPTEAAAESLAKPGVSEAIATAGNDNLASYDGETTSDTITFNFATLKFGAPGIYYYTLTATDPEVKGLTVNTNTYIVKVYVENVVDDGGNILPEYKIANVTMYKEGEYPESGITEDKKVAGLTSGDNFAATYDAEVMNLTKELKGAMANMSDKFGFTIKITDPDMKNVEGTARNLYASKVDYTVAGGTKQSSEFVNGVATIEVSAQSGIGDGQSISVSGIPESARIEIVEATNDYITSWNGATSDSENSQKAAIDSAMETNDVTVTNTKNSVTPTGIVMNVAPYVLLVVVAAAGCFVFLRKRRED